VTPGAPCYGSDVNVADEEPPVVAVVDDDESVRVALQGALRSIGLHARSFASAEAFLESGIASTIGCLITDLQMPGMNGLELQLHLARSGRGIPIIFITAFGESRLRAQAMKAGAVAFFDKPFDDDALLQTVRTVLDT